MTYQGHELQYTSSVHQNYLVIKMRTYIYIFLIFCIFKAHDYAPIDEFKHKIKFNCPNKKGNWNKSFQLSISTRWRKVQNRVVFTG